MCAHTPARRGKRARVTPRASGGARARRCWSDEPVASGSPEATARVAMSGGAAEQAGGGAVVRSARSAQAACFFVAELREAAANPACFGADPTKVWAAESR